ncbi:MAG TPA: HupE/UreJ family protein [Burkholderiales bacterium]|nr:HupE/UreJ family protein [Burkholderiales bacterium]
MKARHYNAMAVSACAATLPMLAHAHHAMDNELPGTPLEGLLSGLAHPIVGIDHLLFVLAIGATCFYFGQRAGAVAAFLGAALAGTVVHLYRATLPYPDAWVALSLVVLGVLIWRAAPMLRSKAVTAFFALAGIAHGYAYGESIVGAEQTPLFAYLAGYTLVQLLVVLAGYALASLADRKHSSPIGVKAVGGALSVAGVAFLLLGFAA